MGKVRVQWFCHLNDPFVISKAELSPQQSQGETNESIQEIITNHMVLPISYRMGFPSTDSGCSEITLALEVEKCIWIFSEQQGCEVEELNVQVDHVHLLVLVPPKVSISGYVGAVKGRTAIRILNKFRNLKEKPYWGNHFWARGYCVDTVGLDAEMIQKYVKYQEAKDRDFETPKY